MQVQGFVKATARNGTGFMVNDQWYNIYQGEKLPEKGSTVSFFAVTEYDGKTYAQNMQVTPPRRGGGGKGKQRSPRDVYGPIVGHNLLIAATLLHDGATVEELVDMARRITIASEQLVDEVVAQKTHPQQQPQQQPAPLNQGYGQPAASANPNGGYPPTAAAPVQPQQPHAPPPGSDDIPWG